MPEQYQLVETRLQEKLENGTTRCNLCLWHCKIGHGQRGFCQAHVNRNGTLYNLLWHPVGDRYRLHRRETGETLSTGNQGDVGGQLWLQFSLRRLS